MLDASAQERPHRECLEGASEVRQIKTEIRNHWHDLMMHGLAGLVWAHACTYRCIYNNMTPCQIATENDLLLACLGFDISKNFNDKGL